MPSEIEALRQEIAALRDAIAPAKPHKTRQPYTCINLRLSRDDDAIIRAEAEALGITKSELVRRGLAHVLSRALSQPREIPPQFRKHRKLQHFDDGKAPVREMASAEERSAKAREAVRLGYAAREAMAEAGLAPEVVSRERALSQRGMMADAPLRTVLKPSR